MSAQRLTRPSVGEITSADGLFDYMRRVAHALIEAGVDHGEDFYVVPATLVEGDDPRFSSLSANVVPLHHAGDPSSSKRAAFDVFPRTGTQRLRVFECVAQSGFQGVTAEECARRTGMRSGASGNSAAKRLSELRAGGWVAPSGEHRKTENGVEAEVLVLTAKGREEWAKRSGRIAA